MGTYTYALLEVSKETFDEVSKKLMESKYEHAFHELKEGRVIDMHGLALCTSDNFPKDEVLYERNLTMKEALEGVLRLEKLLTYPDPVADCHKGEAEAISLMLKNVKSALAVEIKKKSKLPWISDETEIPKPGERIIMKLPDGRVCSGKVTETEGFELDYVDNLDLVKAMLSPIEWLRITE